jgi:hypothetical protein
MEALNRASLKILSARNVPPPETATRHAKLDVLIRDFGEMKTGLCAALKTRALLQQRCPELASAIAKLDPTAISALAAKPRK